MEFVIIFIKMPQGQAQTAITSTAATVDCPPNPFPPGAAEATCVGGSGYNGFSGHGQVNAFNAVTHTTQPED